MAWWRRAAGSVVVALALAVPSGGAFADGCAAGASCFTTDDKGKLDPTGKYTTQCTGRFPDYVDLVPENYAGRRFAMSQQYPAKRAPAGSPPWATIDFKTEAGAVEYLMKLREYIYEGMEAADWRIEANAVRKWYHVPRMHVGRNPREFVRGLTRERSIAGPELGVKQGVTTQNYAVGFYNDVGAPTIGAVWKNAAAPDPKRAQSANGTVVAKVLFSAAQPADFEDGDLLEGAPAWDANIFVRFPAPEKNIKAVATPGDFVSLDYSLQQSVAFQNFRNGNFHNTCADVGPTLRIKARPPAAKPEATPYLQYPVVR